MNKQRVKHTYLKHVFTRITTSVPVCVRNYLLYGQLTRLLHQTNLLLARHASCKIQNSFLYNSPVQYSYSIFWKSFGQSSNRC